jgi:hypothetical protein
MSCGNRVLVQRPPACKFGRMWIAMRHRKSEELGRALASDRLDRASHRTQAGADALASRLHGFVAADRRGGRREAPEAAHYEAHVRDRRPGRDRRRPARREGASRALVHACDRGLSPLLEDADRERSQGAHGVPASRIGEACLKPSAENGKPDQPSNPMTKPERRRADSNRCTRLCRPLPNLSATAPDGSS